MKLREIKQEKELQGEGSGRKKNRSRNSGPARVCGKMAGVIGETVKQHRKKESNTQKKKLDKDKINKRKRERRKRENRIEGMGRKS
jgi:hypothetical protein